MTVEIEHLEKILPQLVVYLHVNLLSYLFQTLADNLFIFVVTGFLNDTC